MRSLTFTLLSLGLLGCGEPPAGNKFYDRVIQPIFDASCVRQTSGCHVDNGTGNAFGNLDLSSFAAVSKRRDVLRVYGSYPIALLLLKAVGRQSPPITYKGGGTTQTVPSEIDHAGAATISVDSNAFFELQRWISNGATEDGVAVERPKGEGTGSCRADFNTLRSDSANRINTVDTNGAAYQNFVANVEPILVKSCAFATCHSSEQSDFHIACSGGDNSKFNFLEAQAFLTTPVESSLLLAKPLSPSSGGTSHTGGVFFASKADEEWQKLSSWAALAGVGSATATLKEGQKFFNTAVMPVLLKRGCALEACHSPGAANDLKLRAGTQGFFPSFSLQSSYRSAREFLRPDVPDVRQSRLVKKPIIPLAENGVGIIHRGGPVLQSPGDPIDLSMCPQGAAFDAANADPVLANRPTAMCVVAEWHRRERVDLGVEIDALAGGDTVSFLVVERPAHPDRLIDFDIYHPGADLVEGTATLSAPGTINPASVVKGASVLAGCPGTTGTRDIRHPDVSYDGQKLVFAMRLSVGEPFDLYEISGGVCTKLTTGKAGPSQSGILLHDIDPMYTPTGALVFASTRGRPGLGPTRSPKFLLPQTDLWRMQPAGASYGAPEQMTALNGSELSPAMMANGQVTFTAEKATPEFYQLSGRRINWDLTDYHPLLSQRAQSPALDGSVQPSTDYAQATEIREGIDRNFVFILSDVGAKAGGGALAIFNRSIGPFQANRFDTSFLRAVTILDPAASGRVSGASGAYRSPLPLPDGKILVSYAPDAQNGRFDLVIVDAVGNRQAIAAFSGGASYVEPVLRVKREKHAMFVNVHQLVFGGSVDGSDAAHGIVHYTDLPMLGTLLGANLRSGRFVSNLRPATDIVVYEDQPPPADLAAAMAGRKGTQNVYQSLRELGKAGLAEDGSVQLRLPALLPTILELRQGQQTLFTMTENDQLGPGERISRGVPEQFFNSTCGGCHGSVSGIELDVAPNPDALTGASVSLSRDPSRRNDIGP